LTFLNVLQENYGSSNEDKVSTVKALFKDLKLEEAFTEYEESSYEEIMQLIDSKSALLPRELFVLLVNKIYKRNR